MEGSNNNGYLIIIDRGQRNQTGGGASRPMPNQRNSVGGNGGGGIVMAPYNQSGNILVPEQHYQRLLQENEVLRKELASCQRFTDQLPKCAENAEIWCKMRLSGFQQVDTEIANKNLRELTEKLLKSERRIKGMEAALKRQRIEMDKLGRRRVWESNRMKESQMRMASVCIQLKELTSTFNLIKQQKDMACDTLLKLMESLEQVNLQIEQGYDELCVDIPEIRSGWSELLENSQTEQLDEDWQLNRLKKNMIAMFTLVDTVCQANLDLKERVQDVHSNSSMETLATNGNEDEQPHDSDFESSSGSANDAAEENGSKRRRIQPEENVDEGSNGTGVAAIVNTCCRALWESKQRSGMNGGGPSTIVRGTQGDDNDGDAVEAVMGSYEYPIEVE